MKTNNALKRVESAESMAAEFNKDLKIRKVDNFFAEKVDSVAVIMQTTNGRDKMCAILQYCCDFYYYCMKDSEEVWNHLHWSVESVRKVSRNVSSSRKMLKFMQFMIAIKKFYLFQKEKSHKSISIKLL